ncbi:unnamed protein product, partial [Rotaria magnacalcarata]
MYSIVKTQKGSTTIYYQQNYFRLQKTNKNGSNRWVCTNRQCSSSLILKKGLLQKVRGSHSHSNIKHSLPIIKKIAEIRQEVCNSPSKPIPQIYNDAVSQYRQHNGTAESVPIFDIIRSALYRDRATVLPKLPVTLNDFIIPEIFTKNLYNEKMLFCDQNQTLRILGFASLSALKEL